MYKRTTLMIILLLLVTLVVSSCGGNSKKTVYLSIATGGMSGTYYPIGGGISNIINNKVEGVSTTVESTGASVANMNLIKEEKTELAIVASSIAYNAYNGIGSFEGAPVKNVAGITSLYPEAVQVVVLQDSGINSFEDLRGKKVAVGKPGSGVEVMAQELLTAYNMSYDDIEEDFLGFSEAATGLKDNTIDAAIVWAGVPTAGVVDIATQKKIRIIKIDNDKLEAIKAKLPYCSSHVIKGGTYTGFYEDVTTIAIPAILVVKADMDTEIVYNITKAIFENLEELANVHERGKDISLETALNGMGIPLHPGAEKYFKERGIIK